MGLDVKVFEESEGDRRAAAFIEFGGFRNEDEYMAVRKVNIIELFISERNMLGLSTTTKCITVPGGWAHTHTHTDFTGVGREY